MNERKSSSLNIPQIFSLFFLLLLVWEGGVYIYQYSSDRDAKALFSYIILPSPLQIIKTMLTRWDLLWPHILATFMGMSGSLFIAVILSIPLGFCMAYSKKISIFFQTCFLIFKSVPPFCFVPVLIIFMGFGLVSSFLPAVLSGMVPITMSVFEALRSEQKGMHEYFSMMKASSIQRFRFLHLPSIVQNLFSGFRMAILGSGMATIAGEWCGGRSGLGILLMDMREQLDVPMMFACIMSLSCITTLIYIGSNCIEQILKPEQRRYIQENFSFFLRYIRHRSLIFWSSIFFALLSLFFFSSCTVRKEGKEEKKKNISLTLMLDWSPSPTHIPLYHGLLEGYFAEEGIDLNIIKKGDCDSLQLLQMDSGVDLIISYFPRIIRVQSLLGPVMRVIGTMIPIPMNGFLAADDVIHTLQEIDGKEIGFSGSKFSSSTLDLLLEARGIFPGKKKNLRLDLIPQLLFKNIDVIWGAFRMVEPYQMEAFGKKPIFFGVEEFGMPSYHELIIVAKRGGKACEKKQVQSFQRALQKSLNDAQIREEKALLNYFSFFPEKGEMCKIWEKKAWYALAPSLSKKQDISLEDATCLTTWLHEKGIIDSSVDLSLLLEEISSY